ncbi:pre-rRNA processing protein, FCF1 (nucleomorph) [Cryptomonas paramecium]|uniref:Pre-rRNA processing protein, FCF1 n=1 Tax=Cryptomonas paramaecium TaxID=2898 RepID=F2HHV8_9CRYP|nr:pre-rRNA processing protein, FCF1 [Cryptomonas paramecium]AEA38904.1 pre-rRNA processing protein, FCF1 [Cryptomonas paramecium]|mmetsp:Transcript_37052/g.98556  ORF Transcript_37052/g.98556 Transcript_37052/m.98556 type:complete len:150 (-) Transcript_37052:14922-15371(-)
MFSLNKNKFKPSIDRSKLTTISASPYLIILDTNFIYFSLKNKINLFQGLSTCLSGLYIPFVPECVISEIRKLGPRFKTALECLRDRRIIKYKCNHVYKIIYADSCIENIIKRFKCFMVATCDSKLKKRLKILSKLPIISIKKKSFFLET